MDNGILSKYFGITLAENKHWIRLQDFGEYLVKNHVDSDAASCPRLDNLKRTLAKLKDGLTLNGTQYITITSALRYIYNHVPQLSSCNVVASDIEAHIVGATVTDISDDIDSIFELYKEVAKGPLKVTQLLLDVQFDQPIQTLFDIHKEYFNEFEWKKICLFEYHFGLQHKEPLETIDHELKARRDYYKKCLSALDVAKTWRDMSKQLIVNRLQRFSMAREEEGVELYGAQEKHLPSVIDAQLLERVVVVCPDRVSSIVCTNSEESTKLNGLHVYVEMSTCDLQPSERNEISQVIESTLLTCHELQCLSIVFFEDGVFDQYKRGNKIARFLCRDDLMGGKLSRFVLYQYFPHNIVPESSEQAEKNKCHTCYMETAHTPLGLKSFHLVTEWHLDVPLMTQILLETFINKNSLRRCKDVDKLVLGKLERLYCLYDSLLNIANRRYAGLFQEANTDELLMHFKSVSSVFAITSSIGATKSLTTAERSLKVRSIDDLCYFTTYLKAHPLTYMTTAGLVSKPVNMRSCHIIFMLDNLVRLKFRNDPEPGESRSKQICTLPITLQGLPKDAIEVSTWHNPSICDGTNDCPCKEATSLTKASIPVITALSGEECQTLHMFNQMCVWGHLPMWKDIEKSELSQFLKSPDQADVMDDSDSDSTTDDDVCIAVVSESEAHLGSNHEEAAQDEEENLERIIEKAVQIQEESNDLAKYDLLCVPNFSSDYPPEEGISPLDTTPVEQSYAAAFGGDNEVDNSDDNEIVNLQTSIGEMSLNVLEETVVEGSNIPQIFDFVKYQPPKLLYRHPPPAVGRDDDIYKLQEILDEQLVRLGHNDKAFEGRADKILVGADHKIANNLIKLLKQDRKYSSFIPEFPLLHMRKSKINTLFSAYKSAGLLHLLQYMRDDEQQEWTKLVSAEHINTATQNVRRLSVALHISFLVNYMQTLDSRDREKLIQDIQCERPKDTMNTWNEKYEQFITSSSQDKATFALHLDMMRHCDDVVALALAERLGGEKGYTLLLAVCKSSLSFSFLNGASSYSPFCMHLLHEHYSAGYFHTKMKESLFSTPIKGSIINFACDTKREMDHQDVMKGFRSGSTTSSVLSRMSVIDSLNEVHERYNNSVCQKEDDLGWDLSEVDNSHIVRTASLILRRGGLSSDVHFVPYNVYTKTKTMLSADLLDQKSNEAGEYLVEKFACKENLFGRTSADAPDIGIVSGPKSLLDKLKRSKGVTLRRTAISSKQIQKTESQLKEEKRVKGVARELKHVQCLSSEMNTCQSLVRPDCSKPKVQKAMGVQNAIKKILSEDKFSPHDLMQLKEGSVPEHAATNVKVAAIEFAGMKFKTTAVTGTHYIQQVQARLLQPLMKEFKNLERIIVCEEKYSHTPDDFKAATRKQRAVVSSKSTISHLKTGKDIVSESTFSKTSINSTDEGKMLISKYLAQNVQILNIKANLILDIDSELYQSGCQCAREGKCLCSTYTIPIRCYFNRNKGLENVTKLENVHQRKGEAELAVMDWLFDATESLNIGDAVVTIVTSADIDSVVIHLFCLPLKWPRNEDGTYKYPVHVILQKACGKKDTYNITGILENLEHRYSDRYIGVKVAVLLCMGGNDFVPKFYGISHAKVLMLGLTDYFRDSLIEIESNSIKLNVPMYVSLVKHLFCPKRLDPSASFHEIREATIQPQRQPKGPISEFGTVKMRNPQLWLPPMSALNHVASLIQLEINYLLTAGKADAPLPDFLGSECLVKNTSGEIEYNFGPESHITSLSDILPRRVDIPTNNNIRKRSKMATPQKGQRKKLPMTSTPKKGH